jgi:hypothetical protein
VSFGRARKGDVVNCVEPDWRPLLKVAPEVVTEFMWMFEVRLRDDTRIHAYKHRWTRRYVHLTIERHAWGYEPPGKYRRAYLYRTVISALRPWWRRDDLTPAERDYHRALDMLYMERLGEFDDVA